MIFRHLTQILCWMLIANSAIKNVRAISFDVSCALGVKPLLIYNIEFVRIFLNIYWME